MNKKLFIFIALLLAGMTASARDASKHGTKTYAHKYRYELIQDRNFYLDGSNIAGIRCDSVNISEAILGASYTFGEGRDFSQAPRTWTAGANASTIMHLKKFSMFGKFSFAHTSGYDMTGSMMVNPGRYPIDVMEFTPGEKAKQNYAFTGGISTDISENFRLGARADFSATNYVKYKDLRYTNYALDLSLRPGMQWHRDDLSLGMALALERNTETITAEQVGETSEVYTAFLNKGLWYGVCQQWNGSATHLSESGISGLPIMEIGYGASAQVGFKAFYADLAYLHSNGKIGEKDAIWFTFPTNKLNLTLGWKTISSHGVQHIIRLRGGFKNTVLNETSIDKVTSGGVTTRKTIGSNRILNKDNYELKPSWEAILLDKFDATVSLCYKNETAVSTMQYPFVAEQSLNTIKLQASANAHCIPSVLVGLGFWGGCGFISDNMRMSVSNIQTASELYRQSDQYLAWKNLMTDFYSGVSATIRYTFKNNVYIRADLSTEFILKSHRTSVGLSCGYNF